MMSFYEKLVKVCRMLSMKTCTKPPYNVVQNTAAQLTTCMDASGVRL